MKPELKVLATTFVNPAMLDVQHNTFDDVGPNFCDSNAGKMLDDVYPRVKHCHTSNDEHIDYQC